MPMMMPLYVTSAPPTIVASVGIIESNAIVAPQWKPTSTSMISTRGSRSTYRTPSMMSR